MMYKKITALLTTFVLLAGCSALPAAAFEDDQPESVEGASNDTFLYLRTDDHVEITGLSTEEAPKKLVIPETIDGLPVTEIGDGAFEGCKNIAEISVPDTLQDVGIYAFYGTTWLDSQPNGIVYVGHVAYQYKGWEIPEELRLREGTTAIAGWAFGDGSMKVYSDAWERQYRTVPLIVPKSVKYINTSYDRSFSAMPLLHPGNIYYEGSREEWEQITLFDDFGAYPTRQDFYNRSGVYFGTTEPSHEPRYTNVIIPGDVTNDGIVTIMDVITLNQHLMTGTYLNDTQKKAADIDGNGIPDAVDSLRILKGIVEIDPLPEPVLEDVGEHNDFYQYGLSLSEDCYSLLNNADLSPQLEYDIYEGTRESGKVYQHIKLRDADIATLDAFAAAHFSEKNTPAEKLYFTHQWIHYNNDYAYVGEKWDTIVAKSYVDAIFNYRLGQCIQYNGAMAGMLAYMGYHVWMEGTPGVHWTTYVEIDGRVYNVECGNYGKNGEWQGFFALEEDH